MQIGINVDGVKSYGTLRPFVDAMRHSDPWEWSGPWGAPWATPATLPPLATDADGYPTVGLPYQHADGKAYAARAYPFHSNGSRFPAGDYTLSFDGNGTISVRLDGSSKPALFDQAGGIGAPRTLRVASPGSIGLYVEILRSDPGDHVRNVRLMLPGFASYPSPFHPDFLALVRPFDVLRWMCWDRCDSTSIGPWSGRTTPSTFGYGGAGGAALEFKLAACNALGRPPWLCIPTAADDSYIAGMARLALDQLHPSLPLYLEFGNEQWNWGFWDQFKLVESEAGAAQPRRDHYQETAALAAHAFGIWRQVWGDQKGRIKRVLAGQLGNPFIEDDILAWTVAHADPSDPNKGVEVISVATYFQPSAAAVAGYNASTTPQQIANDCLAAIGAPDAKGFPAYLKAVTDQRDKWSKVLGRRPELWAYEGGLGLENVPANAPWLNAFLASADTEEMGQATRKWAVACATAGFDGVNHFSLCSPRSHYGAWSLLPSQDAPPTPRYRALVDYINSRG